MKDYKIASKYKIESTIITNSSLSLHIGINTDRELFRIHQIKDKHLIKYYLQHLNQLKPTMPFVESFVINSDLYLIFKDYSRFNVITNPKYSNFEIRTLLLSLFAKLALDNSLPNFFKYTLLKSDNLMIDSNLNLYFNSTLDLLNPDSLDDFKSVQKKISSLIDTLLGEDEILKQFVLKCENGQFIDYMDLFTEFKRIVSEQYEYNEPWIYERMHDFVLFIIKNFRRLVFIGIFLLFSIYGIHFLVGSSQAMEVPYLKSKIGVVTYDDPYSDHPQELEYVSVYIPQILTPPTAVESQEKMTNEFFIYIVPPGDYLYKISSEVYGDRKYALTIAVFNNLENPDFLPVNYPLKLPTKENIERLYELLNEKTTD